VLSRAKFSEKNQKISLNTTSYAGRGSPVTLIY